MVIAFEGLPGAGKTTSAELVGRRLGAVTLRETTGDHPFLDSVYDDERRYDLEVELAFLLLHAGPYRRIERGRVNVTDYSPAKDVLFARDTLGGEDLDLWMRAYQHVYRDQPLPDAVVFLRVSPEECLRRARQRGRAFESGLTLDRLQRMEALYESHLPELGQYVLELDVSDVGEGPDEVAEKAFSLLNVRSPLGSRIGSPQPRTVRLSPAE